MKRKMLQAKFLQEFPDILYIVWRDITKEHKTQKQEEQVLEKALDVAQKANQVKKEFLLHISKDIGTPLYELSGILQQLQLKQTGDDSRAYIGKAMKMWSSCRRYSEICWMSQRLRRMTWQS